MLTKKNHFRIRPFRICRIYGSQYLDGSEWENENNNASSSEGPSPYKADAFISCLDSHSDGTHSLQSIHC